LWEMMGGNLEDMLIYSRADGKQSSSSLSYIRKTSSYASLL
jgi:hypothetical protein